MALFLKNSNPTVKVYHGYGHANNCIVYGHVFLHKPVTRKIYTNNIVANIIHLLRLFLVKPMANAKVQLQWKNQLLHSTTADDGFFKFEWKPGEEVSAGWHMVFVKYTDGAGNIKATGEGNIFIPHSTQYAFISDIDDTVLISHSATTGKKLRVLFTKNPRTRKAFTDVVKHYELLAFAHTEPNVPNPFFYVSSSEWNLYDDLNDFFNHNGLPEGIFLLNQVKRWFQLLKTGKTKHEGKLIRIVRILEAFPKQQFVLLGDNSQRDPEIYASIAKKYPGKIFAVYIRNISKENETVTLQELAGIQNTGTHICLFKDNTDAIEHSKGIGLIN